jgi:hypothetical protein
MQNGCSDYVTGETAGATINLKTHPVVSYTWTSTIKLVLRLVLWVGFLGTGAALSLVFPSLSSAGHPTMIIFRSAIAAVYLSVFVHCLLRFANSRWASWLFYTAGFGFLAFFGAVRLVFEAGILTDPFFKESIGLFDAAVLSLAVILLIAGAHSVRARIHGHKAGAWKNYLAGSLAILACALAARAGAGSVLNRLLISLDIQPVLAVYGVSVTALAVLMHRTCKLQASAHDEVISPISYWAAAMTVSVGLRMSAAGINQMDIWQANAVELAAAMSLILGLSLVNERAHRVAGEQMADLAAMQGISWSLVGSSDVNGLTNALAKALKDGFSARHVAVYLPGRDDGEMVIAAVYGIEDESVAPGRICSLKPARRPGFHNGHTARAYISGESQVVSEVFSDVEFLSWRTVAREQGMVVSVALPYEDRIIGVINLFFAEVDRISESRIRLLESVAAAVSPAIVHAMEHASTGRQEFCAA